LTYYFVDSSALAKRYVAETGSSWVQSWITPSARNIILISELATIEIVKVLAFKQQDSKIPYREFIRLRNQFLLDVENEYYVIKLEGNVISRARKLISKHRKLRLRTLDAIQLASDVEITRTLGQAPIFICADKGLHKIALAEGFTVDNPENHP
jgi:uncharacterized protein